MILILIDIPIIFCLFYKQNTMFLVLFFVIFIYSYQLTGIVEQQYINCTAGECDHPYNFDANPPMIFYLLNQCTRLSYPYVNAMTKVTYNDTSNVVTFYQCFDSNCMNCIVRHNATLNILQDEKVYKLETFPPKWPIYWFKYQYYFPTNRWTKGNKGKLMNYTCNSETLSQIIIYNTIDQCFNEKNEEKFLYSEEYECNDYDQLEQKIYDQSNCINKIKTTVQDYTCQYSNPNIYETVTCKVL